MALLQIRWNWKRWLGLAFGSLNIWLLSAFNPVSAAERVRLSYGIFERTISIDALETYARTGEVSQELSTYTQNLNPTQLAQLRQILINRIPLTSVEVSQFLYSPIGQRLLDRLAAIIETDADEAGFYGIRSALILAAADPDGLTLLNILRQFPLEELEVDLARGQAIAQAVETFVSQTNQAVTQINQQAATATPEPLPSFAAELQQPGPLRWQQETIVLDDQSRDRTIPVDIYLPIATTSRPVPHPVIVISHGLGSDRTSFAYLAQHLASYGFVVAVPEHPGSSAMQLQALLAGSANQVTLPSEFIDRPLDVSYLLDELSRLSDRDPTWQDRLNLEQVGVIGQSFGGYTALALAGAPLQLEQLETDCQNLDDSLNASLLLQCVALGLPRNQYDLSDPRIKAAIAINPVDSSILGEAGLSQVDIPVMIVSGSDDTIAPALPEQIQPFTWLSTPNKYLLLINNGTHFSAIAESPNAVITVPQQVIGYRPNVVRDYMQAFGVAFAKTYVANQSEYCPYLSNAYAEAIDEAPLELSLVQSISALMVDRQLELE
jgi:predicted dienelactone hydrolase